MAVLSSSQVAAELGVTKQAIVKWYHQRKFPNAFKAGSHIKIPPQDVEAFKQRPEVDEHTEASP